MPYTTVWLVTGNKSTKNAIGQIVPDAKLIDVPDLAKQIEDAYNDWEKQGIEVVNTIPITVGGFETAIIAKAGPTAVAAYSHIRGVILVGKS